MEKPLKHQRRLGLGVGLVTLLSKDLKPLQFQIIEMHGDENQKYTKDQRLTLLSVVFEPWFNFKQLLFQAYVVTPNRFQILLSSNTK